MTNHVAWPRRWGRQLSRAHDTSLVATRLLWVCILCSYMRGCIFMLPTTLAWHVQRRQAWEHGWVGIKQHFDATRRARGIPALPAGACAIGSRAGGAAGRLRDRGGALRAGAAEHAGVGSRDGHPTERYRPTDGPRLGPLCITPLR